MWSELLAARQLELGVKLEYQYHIDIGILQADPISHRRQRHSLDEFHRRRWHQDQVIADFVDVKSVTYMNHTSRDSEIVNY